MALNHIGVQIAYGRLSRLLRAGPSFTPFSNLRHLESLGLSITIGRDGDVSLFEQHIDLGLPVLVAVRTINWLHWGNEVADHAVVVVGIDQNKDAIFINDPFLAGAPIEMELIRFETGWEELDRRYSVISLAPPEEQI
jgi:hypothetical protein